MSTNSQAAEHVNAQRVLNDAGEVVVDERGVGRTQIRRMLALTPVERVRRLEAFIDDVMEVRRLNEQG